MRGKGPLARRAPRRYRSSVTPTGSDPAPDAVEAATIRLREVVRPLGSALVAFSGGLDSALVLRVATLELGERAVGLTAVGPALPEEERLDAARVASVLGARHVFVDSQEIDDPDYASNPINRCFFCKSELYRITARTATELGLAHVVNGTNLDDLGDYRPGLDAAREHGVRSPLVEAGLDKEAVRAVARHLGMDVWDKPASACLASRIPYGTPVTRERLARIERFESDLRALGFRQVRVRHHEDLARVELGRAEMDAALAEPMRTKIVEAGKAVGYRFVTLDLAGYRMGSFNERLPVVR